MKIIYEDNHLLVVVKPPGLVTQGADAGEPSLITEAKAYLKRKYQKPGNVYLGVVSRLDAPVSGVVVLARTSKAADRLTKLFRERDVSKSYWAIVAGTPPREGELRDWLIKDERVQRVVVTKPQTPGAKEAVLHYRTLGTVSGGTWLEVQLVTGRKHQIRVQLASRGWPILGDHKYGSRAEFASGIALHAREVEIEHPTTKERLTFTADLPSGWKAYGLE